MLLKDRWRSHCMALGIPADVTERYWNTMETRYSEKQRFYHTLEHINDMFQHFDTVKNHLQQPHLVAMAIFFHDIIYEPTKPDNEEQSADLYKEFSLESGSDKDDSSCQSVVDWILATKHHKTDVHTCVTGEYGTTDLHYLLDMDMSILAVSPSEYELYARNIRKEYIHYPEEQFNQGRAKVLRNFLGIPNIYATEMFRTKYEQNARANIEAEIKRLEEGT